MKQAETEVVVGDKRMRDRKGRKQLTGARWEQLLSEYEASGVTQAEFARRNGLVYTTFAHRVQQRRREAKAGVVAPRFVEVRPALGKRTAECLFDQLSMRHSAVRLLSLVIGHSVGRAARPTDISRSPNGRRSDRHLARDPMSRRGAAR